MPVGLHGRQSHDERLPKCWSVYFTRTLDLTLEVDITRQPATEGTRSTLTATPGVNIHDLHCRWVTWTGCRRGWWRRSLWSGAPPPPVGPGSGWVRWGVHSSPSLRTPSRRRTGGQSSAVPPRRQREESRTRATERCASCCLRLPARPSSGEETVDGGNDRNQPVAWIWRHVRRGNVVLGCVLGVLAVNWGFPPFKTR